MNNAFFWLNEVVAGQGGRAFLPGDNKECRPKVLALDPLNLHVTMAAFKLLHNHSIQVAIPPAAPSCSMANGRLVEQAVHERAQQRITPRAAAPVLKQQSQLLRDSVRALEVANHHAVLDGSETDGSVFKRLFIFFHEGKQSFDASHECGLQLDGAFLKSDIGGILFVACLKDSNNSIHSNCRHRRYEW